MRFRSARYVLEPLEGSNIRSSSTVAGRFPLYSRIGGLVVQRTMGMHFNGSKKASNNVSIVRGLCFGPP